MDAHFQHFFAMLARTLKRGCIKAQALKLIKNLPANSTWNDLMYSIYVCQKIEAGLADLRAGRTHPHASIRREFGLDG